MRKILIGIFMFICVLLVGCGDGGKPDDVSDEMYEAAVYAIKVVDLYLDGQATLDETYDKLDNMKVPDYEMEYPYMDFSTDILISALKSRVLSLRIGSGQISDLKSKRDELAEKINYKD